MRGAFQPLSLPKPPEGGPRKEARLFLNALLHAGHTALGAAQLIVLQLSPDRIVSGGFNAALMKEISRGDQPAFVLRIEGVDLTGTLLPDDYFRLDDHIQASGHAKVAAALLGTVKRALAR